MFKYAQIDFSTGRCISVSFLSGEVEAGDMIPLTDEDNVNPNDIFENGVWIPAPPPEPVSPLELKLAELNEFCNAIILAGFTSNALGTDNTYDFDYDAQINLGGMLNAITAGLVTGAITWKTSGVPQTHTIDQFKTVFSDGLTHKNANIGKYWTLKAQVLTAATPEEIAAIVW